jgi:hypothetical protein
MPMNRTITEEAATALEALDATTLVGLYRDEFEFEDVAAGEILTTKDDLQSYYTALFSMPGVRFSEITSFECGEQGVIAWTWSATNRRTGEPFSIRGVSVLDLAPDGAVREVLFYDPRPAL